MQQKRGLGRGLESLIPPKPAFSSTTSEVNQTNYHLIPLEKLIPNRQQPRSIFDEGKIKQLAESIKRDGVLQPLIVSELSDGRYELIAGERRLRAAREAELSEVPCIIRDVDQEDVLALSILENIQREDLNAIEEAYAYQELAERYQYSQDEIAKRMGKSRTTVTNSLRLLKLPRAIQEDVITGRYSAGHARALLGLSSLHDQLKMRELLLERTPSVRDVERLVQERGVQKSVAKKNKVLSPQFEALVEKMKQKLGTKVTLQPRKEGSGKIVIEYYSEKDLDRITTKLIV